MTTLPYPYEDVFSAGIQGLSPHLSDIDDQLGTIEGADMYAADNTYLGRVTRNAFDGESLANEFSTYGNSFNANSIFNKFGPYGNPYSQLSPFNEFSRTPPRLMKGQKILAYVSNNQFVSPRVDPRALLAWLGRGQ